MGNKHSINNDVIIRDKNCIICFEKINGNCTSCCKCRVLSHHKCYFLWNQKNNYTTCPMCRRIGTLMTSSIEDEINIDTGKTKIKY